jgi:hypothetical protein
MHNIDMPKLVRAERLDEAGVASVGATAKDR